MTFNVSTKIILNFKLFNETSIKSNLDSVSRKYRLKLRISNRFSLLKIIQIKLTNISELLFYFHFFLFNLFSFSEFSSFFRLFETRVSLSIFSSFFWPKASALLSRRNFGGALEILQKGLFAKTNQFRRCFIFSF